MLCQNCGMELSKELSVFYKYLSCCPHCNTNWANRFCDIDDDILIDNIVKDGERTVGAEIETNLTPKSACEIWNKKMVHFKHDGSLRGVGALELVTPILSESTFEPYFNTLCGLMDVSEWYSRQSTHVHIGTQDLGWFELNCLVAKAIQYERFFTALCPPSRAPLARDRVDGGPRRNTEVPIFSNKSEMMRFFYGRDNLRHRTHSNMSAMRANKRCNDGNARDLYPGGILFRYNWLNIHGHFHKGAVEWRIFSSTKKAEKINNWIKLLIQFTNAAHSMTGRKFLSMPISHMITADVWQWALNRIESLKDLHLNAGTMDPAWYSEDDEMPIAVRSIISKKSVSIPPPTTAIENINAELERMCNYVNLFRYLEHVYMPGRFAENALNIRFPEPGPRRGMYTRDGRFVQVEWSERVPQEIAEHDEEGHDLEVAEEQPNERLPRDARRIIEDAAVLAATRGTRRT